MYGHADGRASCLPSKRSFLLSQFSVVLSTCGGQLQLVIGLSLLRGRRGPLNRVLVNRRADGRTAGGLDAVSSGDTAGDAALGLSGVFITATLTLTLLGFIRACHLTAVLEHCIVGHHGLVCVGRSRSPEKARALEDMVQLEGVVLLHDLAISVRDKEDRGKEGQRKSCSQSNTGDPTGGVLARRRTRDCEIHSLARLLIETKSGGTLVDNGQRADSTCNQEEERGRPDRPRHWVLTDVHHVFDQAENDGRENARSDGSHQKSCKDGAQTRTTAPAPLVYLLAIRQGGREYSMKTYLHFVCSDRCNTNTGNGRHERVSRRYVSRVSCAPHDPDRSTSSGASECKELHAGIVVKGCNRDDSVTDGGGCSRTDSEGTSHLKDQTENHSLLICHRTGRHGRSPCVGNIVGTIVVCRTIGGVSRRPDDLPVLCFGRVAKAAPGGVMAEILFYRVYLHASSSAKNVPMAKT